MRFRALIKSDFHQIVILSIMLFSLCNLSSGKTPNQYRNPVIKGDFPDPSIIRVGNTYYAAGTSFDFAPNYPIYESKDLINWKQIAAVFQQPPKWASDDFWAPELYYQDGIFYVYYTTKRKDNRVACIGVATTKDIRKSFTDQGIIIQWGEEAIDAFVFKDDDGKRYICWKAYGLTKGREIEILASELSADGLHLAGETFTLTDHSKGWKGAGDEGPCLMKHNGFYYLFYSVGGCCDNRCDYRVMVARSKNLKSGWEQFAENPIMEGGSVWKCSGHGTLVDTPDKRFFYLYHAYNGVDFEYIGRQGMLDEVVWNNETGWPYFKSGKNPSVSSEVPFKNTIQKKAAIWSDDFSNPKNLAFWQWDVNAPQPSINFAHGCLNIVNTHKEIAFVGLSPQSGNYTLITQIIPTNINAGVGIYSNQQNYIALVVSQSNLVLYKVNKGEKEILSKHDLKTAKSVFLKYEAVNGRYFKFYWSNNGKDWNAIKHQNSIEVDGTFVAQWGYSPRIGFIVEGESKAKFSKITILYDSKLPNK
jgi:xylan 1,4-beta-xylosidase